MWDLNFVLISLMGLLEPPSKDLLYIFCLRWLLNFKCFCSWYLADILAQGFSTFFNKCTPRGPLFNKFTLGWGGEQVDAELGGKRGGKQPEAGGQGVASGRMQGGLGGG